ncbi:hypothetical protein BGZ94_001837 [Podila epigama]|nr:hypothetical protein BGZ94_001837 [Podila epigama]
MSVTREYHVPSSPSRRPKVLIIGGGISGLMLGILLLKGGVPFEIFERSKVPNPAGSAMSMGANLTPLFKQIGIYEEFIALGKPNIGMGVYNDSGKRLFTMDYLKRESICGAVEYIVTRPDFYALLFRQIPSELIHLGEHITSYNEDENGVSITCADGTICRGDIIVGADGTYSSVREQMYRQLKAQGQLPIADDTRMPFNSMCLVGQTTVLDPVDFPGAGMDKNHSQFNFIVGKHSDYSKYWHRQVVQNGDRMLQKPCVKKCVISKFPLQKEVET